MKDDLLTLLKTKIREKLTQTYSEEDPVTGEVSEYGISAKDLASLGSLVIKIREVENKEEEKNKKKSGKGIMAFPAMPAVVVLSE